MDIQSYQRVSSLNPASTSTGANLMALIVSAPRVHLLPLVALMLFAVVTAYAQEKLGREPLGAEFEVLARSELYNRAQLAFDNGEFESAVSLFRQVIAEPKDSNYLMYPSRIRLAMSLSNLGRYDQAEAEIRTGIRQAELADNLGYGIITEGHCLLARILSRQGKYSDAEGACRSRIKAMEKYDSGARSVRNALIEILRMQNKYDEVVTELRLLVKSNPRDFANDQIWLWRMRTDIAEALILSGQSQEGIKEALAMIHGIQFLSGQNEEEILKARLIIAHGYLGLGKPSEAEGQFRIILEAQTKSLGSKHQDTIRTMFEIANCLKAQKKIPGALNTAKRASALSHQLLGADHPDTKKYEKFLSELMEQ